MDELLQEIAKQLTARAWKLTTAESCTGGGVAYYITEIPGSSKWYERSFVCYSDISKEEMLGVDERLILEHGAVSEETVRAMAEGALANSHAQISIAISGIAGPDGGTPEKPVGTVWFAWACVDFPTEVTVHILQGNRTEIRDQAIIIALQELLYLCENN